MKNVVSLQLQDTIKFNKKQNIVQLPDSPPLKNTDAVVTGWGSRKNGGPASLKLQKMETNILMNHQCEELMIKNHNMDRKICTQEKFGVGVCSVSLFFLCFDFAKNV